MRTIVKRIARVKTASSDPKLDTKTILLSIQFLKAGKPVTAMVFTSEEGAYLLSESVGVGIEAISLTTVFLLP